MARVATNVYDNKTKKNLTGYIEGGKTYLSDGSRISAGMQVTDDSGKIWEMGADGKGIQIGDMTTVNTRKPSAQLPTAKLPVATAQASGTVQDDSYIQAIQKAYEAKQQSMQNGLTTQLGEIKQSSDDNRSNVYVNSRLSAIGNNEQLAAKGLAGGLYGSPTSGKSESSRINQDVALGNNINAVNRQQASLENEAKNNVSTGIADNQLQMAKTIAEMRQQQAIMDREEARYQEEMALARASNEKSEFTNTIGAYSENYQSEINKLSNDGDLSNDWKIPYLQSARQDKKAGIAQSQAEAEQQAFENNLKAMETSYKVGKPYYKPSSGTTEVESLLSASEVKGLVAKDEDGNIDENATLANLKKQKDTGNLSEADYAKYVSLYVPSKQIGGTSYDNAKVQQLVNGLGTYMLTGGSKDAVLTQIENLYWSGDLSQTEANAILKQFGIAGI